MRPFCNLSLFVFLSLVAPVAFYGQIETPMPQWQQGAISKGLRDPLTKRSMLELLSEHVTAPESSWTQLAAGLEVALPPWPPKLKSPREIDRRYQEAIAVRMEAETDQSLAALVLARAKARKYLPAIREASKTVLSERISGLASKRFAEALILLKDDQSIQFLASYLAHSYPPLEILPAIRAWKRPELAIALAQYLQTQCLTSSPKSARCPYGVSEELDIIQDLAGKEESRFLADARRNPAVIDPEFSDVLKKTGHKPIHSEIPTSEDSALNDSETIEWVRRSGDSSYKPLILREIEKERIKQTRPFRLNLLVITAYRYGFNPDRALIQEAARRAGLLDEEFAASFGPFPLEDRLPLLNGLLTTDRGAFEIAYLYMECGSAEVDRIRPFLNSVSSRDRLSLIVPAGLDSEQAHSLIHELGKLLEATPANLQMREESEQEKSSFEEDSNLAHLEALLADRIEQAIRVGRHFWVPGDLPALQHLSDLLKQRGFDKEAGSVTLVRDAVFTQASYLKAILTATAFAGMWSLAWILILTLYPHSRTVRNVFFSPSVLRRIWSAGFVDVLLLRISWIRQRILAPFRDQLLSQSIIEKVDQESYFDDFSVTALGDSEQSGSLWAVLGNVKTPTILEGPSGYGKTLFLKKLSQQACREIICYLPAAECKDGVLKAVAAALNIEQMDEYLLGQLVREGALILLIDGLNEVSPLTTRPKIFDLMLRYKRARILATTQRLPDDPPASIARFRLCGLETDRARQFINRKLAVLDPQKADYPVWLRRKEEFLSMDSDFSPLDMTIAAELIAAGEQPSPSRLIAQQLERAMGRMGDLKRFRKLDLAESVWQRYESGDLTLDEESFRLEVTLLAQEKLVIPRQLSLASTEAVEDRKVQSFYIFRHQRVLDFFLAIHLESQEDSVILVNAGREELRGVLLSLVDFPSFSLERGAELEAVITSRELGRRCLIVASEFRRRLGQRWLRERGVDPLGSFAA